ncbi:hypothetical protein PIB30_026129 [Stylosanthes scabra]|uniref:F-box domain-containing protein n=1 Tax=Stylosanthes scabra TaxID=79078 RepID=A0ABU6UC91_9FABA|nr:hypothetical protein [Stylosanthes scabra]
MSDVPPLRFYVPELPTELLTQIFLLCDAKTLIRVQATCHFWKDTLGSYEFVEQMGALWQTQRCSIYGHFGYLDNSRRTHDWVIKFSPSSGQRFPAVLPFELDPAYVTLDGVCFWVTWSHGEENVTPPYIVSFSSLTRMFQQIILPEEIHATCHMLLINDGHLCVAANTHNSEGGTGHAFIPATILDGDVIQVLESHVEIDDVQGMEWTHFHLRRYVTATGKRKTLLCVNYDGGVKLRSIHTYCEGFYPV